MRNLLLTSAALLGTILASTGAQASLVFDQIVDLQGTGIGAVQTILTVQNNGTETGAVAWNGTQDVITGDAKTGNSQTQTVAISQLAPITAADLRIIFNANEGGGPGNAITLQNLVMTIYSANGAALWNSGAFGPVFFPSTEQGTGNSGFAFKLDAAQAAAAAPFFTPATNRIGLAATLTGANSGNETFFALSLTTPGTPVPVPAPAGLALLGAGLLGLGFMRRKVA